MLVAFGGGLFQPTMINYFILVIAQSSSTPLYIYTVLLLFTRLLTGINVYVFDDKNDN